MMFPKKYIFILIFIAAVLLCAARKANATTEFISTIRATGGDYSLLSTWEAAVQSNLTASTTVVYSGTGTGGISAGVTLELFRGGEYQNITAVKVATTSSQFLVQTFTGAYKVLQNGDQWRVASSTNNMWTVSSAGLGDSAIAIAQIDGAWASADTTAVTISGWTTSATNYIKVYTTASARHGGIAGTGYRIITSSPNQPSMYVLEDHVRIEGLEIKNTNTYNNSISGIILGGTSGAPDTDVRFIGLLVHNCSSPSGYESHGINITFGGAGRAGKVIIANSIFYGNQTDGIRAGTNYAALNVYSYNNTFVNNGRYGLYKNWSNNVVAKNCYSGGNAIKDYYASTGSISMTTCASSDTTGSAGLRNISVSNSTGVYFVNLENGSENFHIQSSSLLKDAGTDLSADVNLAFSDDIDGQTRAGTWDIGADEAAENIYRSVGPSKTTALVSGASYGALTVSGSTATFAAGLPDEVGVGDALQYDDDGDGDIDANDSIVFIYSRTSSTTYMVKTASGAVPIAVAGDTDWSLFRAYISLANAETGTENTGIDADLRNFDSWTLGKDISSSTGSNEQWNIACYANGTTADTSSVTIDGWTTSADNYIKIYTPVSSSEVGTSQRHSGKWDEGKYKLVRDGTWPPTVLYVYDDYARVEGLQFHTNSDNTWNTRGILMNTSYGYILIKDNIIKGFHNASAVGHYGIVLQDSDNLNANGRVGIVNNIIYDFNTEGIYNNIWQSGFTPTTGNVAVYNNTVVNCGTGIHNGFEARTLPTIAKNNISYNNTDNYDGTFTSSTNNLSGPTQTDAPGTNPINAAKVVFIDEANDDFHLAPNDYSAVNAGADLSADSYLDFTDDIDGETRPVGAAWDIGADETALTKFRFDGGQMKIRGTIKFE